MTNFIEKLNSLSIRPLKGEYSDSSLNLLDKLKELGAVDDYVAFIEKFSVTSVFDKEVKFYGLEASPTSDEGKELLEVLFAVCDDSNNDLIRINETYSGQLPEGMLIIGEVTGNNLLCLSLSVESSGKVYVWNRDSLSNDKSCYLAANSFLDFIESLQEEDVDESPQTKPQLQSYSLSDDLKAKAAEFLKKQKK